MPHFQNVPSTSGQIIQMEKIEFNDQSMNHCEGGWPKDISYTDSDQTSRHRKKLEKAPLYSKSIKYMIYVFFGRVFNLNFFPITDCSLGTIQSTNKLLDQWHSSILVM